MNDTKAGPYETWSPRLAKGERPAPEQLEGLAGTPDILALGMLADEARRRAHGTRVTFVRVATCAFDKPIAESVPLAAREVRLTGTPDSIDIALTAVKSAKAVAGARAVSGFSLVDLQPLAAGESLAPLLRRLRDAGLDALAEVPVDKLASPEAAVEALGVAGFEHVRLTVSRLPAADRVSTILRMADLAARFAFVGALHPLPLTLNAFRPTTGYEDVKAVAIARLAAPAATHIQVDWQRYGPKLAQVALTFGADDLDNVGASDEAPDGRRRAPLEAVRRNIEAAGFSAHERDGRFSGS